LERAVPDIAEIRTEIASTAEAVKAVEALSKDVEALKLQAEEAQARRESLRERVSVLSQTLAECKVEVDRLQHEKSVIFMQQQRDARLLKGVRKSNASRESQIADRAAEFEKFDAEMMQLKRALADLGREHSLESPTLQEAMELLIAKNQLNRRADELRVILRGKEHDIMLSSNENQMKSRLLAAERYDLAQSQRHIREDLEKIHSVVVQTETLMFQTNMNRKKLHSFREASDRLDEELETRQKMQTLVGIETSDVISMNEQMNWKVEEANRLLQQINDKNMDQMELIDTLRDQRNSFKRQCQFAKQEHEELQKQYSGVVHQIEQMTAKIDVLVKSYTELQFQGSIVNTVITSFIDMQMQCRNGISTTLHMIAALGTELQTMRRIFLHTENDRNAQARELHILTESRQILQAQLALRNQQVQSHKSEVTARNALLEKGEKDFDALMTRIQAWTRELADARTTTVKLLAQKKHLNDLDSRFRCLLENLNIEKMWKMVLYFEGSVRRNVHPWLELEAVNPEALTQRRYCRTLTARILAADDELRRLASKRDRMRDAAAQKRERCELALSKETVTRYMAKYVEDLADKQAMLDTMQRTIDEQWGEATKALGCCTSARGRVLHRKEAAMHFKRESLLIRRADTPESPFVTETPRSADVGIVGGGFDFGPHPPAEPRKPFIPQLALPQPSVLEPQSQRTRRPNIITLRNRLSRPVPTARNDR
jgi:chromosome segregation ATPase